MTCRSTFVAARSSGFLGSNGAGKSTTIRMLCGLLRPTPRNRSRWMASMSAENPRRVKPRIGYMSQRFSLYERLTVDQNISFFGGIYGLSGDQLAARRTVRHRDGPSRGTRVAAGARPVGRVAAAPGARLRDSPRASESSFLDEPTGAVDPLSRRRFWRLIDELAQSGGHGAGHHALPR